jgi:hypothetical protein
MAFVGLTKDQEIVDVIAYLQQFGPEGKQALTAPDNNRTTGATRGMTNEN